MGFEDQAKLAAGKVAEVKQYNKDEIKNFMEELEEFNKEDLSGVELENTTEIIDNLEQMQIQQLQTGLSEGEDIKVDMNLINKGMKMHLSQVKESLKRHKKQLDNYPDDLKNKMKDIIKNNNKPPE